MNERNEGAVIQTIQPFFLMSKKAYAAGQTTLEFIVKENTKMSAQVFITLPTEEADMFKLGKEYDVTFFRKDD